MNVDIETSEVKAEFLAKFKNLLQEYSVPTSDAFVEITQTECDTYFNVYLPGVYDIAGNCLRESCDFDLIEEFLEEKE